MKKKTSILSTAVLFAFGASVMSLPTQFALAQTAAAKPAEQVTKALVNQVREIQDLANAKKFPQALEKIDAIDKVPNKSAYDIHVIAQVKIFIYKNNGDTENLIKAIEVMLQSPFVKPDDKLTFTRAMGSLYDNQKNSEKAREWWTKALTLKEDASLRESIALSYYFDKNYAEAAKLTQAIVDSDVAAGKTPKNDHLKILRSTYTQLEDNAKLMATRELFLTYYPDRLVWGDMLDAVRRAKDFDERWLLDWCRLAYQVGAFDKESQFMLYAQTAMEKEYPYDARAALESGFAANVLGKGENAARHKTMRDKANKRVEEEKNPKFQQKLENDVRTSKTGIGLVNLGTNYVVNNEAERGVKYIEEGIAKGGIRNMDEAKLHLIMGYLKAGNRTKADEIYKTLAPEQAASKLAKLWFTAIK
jgi:hypothetical protein